MTPARPLVSSALVLGVILLAEPRAYAAEPTVGECLAANESSISLRKAHQLKEARTQALVCAATSCPGDIQKECIRRVDQINGEMPTIVFEAKDSAGVDLSAVRVTMDGTLLLDNLAGIAVPIDPGEHSFHFESGKYPAVDKQLVIREAEHDRRESVTFIAPGERVEPAGPAATVAPPAVRPTHHGLGTQRIVALVVGGVGVVGLGVGTVFGLASISKHNSADSACPSDCQDQHGVDLWNESRSAGNIATAGFIVAGVGLAGAAALWFSAKSNDEPGPSAALGVGPGSLMLRGAW